MHVWPFRGDQHWRNTLQPLQSAAPSPQHHPRMQSFFFFFFFCFPLMMMMRFSSELYQLHQFLEKIQFLCNDGSVKEKEKQLNNLFYHCHISTHSLCKALSRNLLVPFVLITRSPTLHSFRQTLIPKNQLKPKSNKMLLKPFKVRYNCIHLTQNKRQK